MSDKTQWEHCKECNQCLGCDLIFCKGTHKKGTHKTNCSKYQAPDAIGNESKRVVSGPGYYITLSNPQPGDVNDEPINEAINHLRRELNKSRRRLRGD